MAIEPIVLTAAGDTLEGPLSYTDETNLSGKLGFIYAKLGDHECRHHDVYLSRAYSTHRDSQAYRYLRKAAPKVCERNRAARAKASGH